MVLHERHPASTVAPWHPLHRVFLAGALPLFLGALLSDIAYYRTEVIQWINFAQWLLAGALVFAAVPLLLALIGLFRGRRALVYVVVLLVLWGVGFVDSLVHASDAWATMPEGLWLSLVAAVLAAIATWLGFTRPRAGGVL